MTAYRPPRERDDSRAPLNTCAAMTRHDIVVAEARRLQAEEIARLLRAGVNRCKQAAAALVGPMLGNNRRAITPGMRRDRMASLAAYVTALRADAEAGSDAHRLGHNA